MTSLERAALKEILTGIGFMSSSLAIREIAGTVAVDLYQNTKNMIDHLESKERKKKK